MKKILGVLTIIVLLVSVCFYFFPKQPKNIFDEIYQETEKTYRSNNILRNIDGFDIKPVWPRDGEFLRYTPSGNYKNIPESYLELRIGFSFYSEDEIGSISFEKHIGSNVNIKMWTVYSHKERSLKKFVKIVLKKADTKNYIEDEAQVKSYLEQYGITAKDLDSYYDEIVNQKVLKDWCSIYDSKYSPSNYGEVKVETQWENW
ncbi:TipC family immunity protein [Streptococcus mitis]|uniref:TipC family immunity protein n=1 Tax=Streptococcus mitis TaxID=28037 RepID=UPI001914159F|nr:TipC family immunity protein [Streptococcus mitis]QQQ36244.1 TipC family immunity protein [Streptococcus mitis]